MGISFLDNEPKELIYLTIEDVSLQFQQHSIVEKTLSSTKQEVKFMSCKLEIGNL